MCSRKFSLSNHLSRNAGGMLHYNLSCASLARVNAHSHVLADREINPLHHHQSFTEGNMLTTMQCSSLQQSPQTHPFSNAGSMLTTTLDFKRPTAPCWQTWMALIWRDWSTATFDVAQTPQPPPLIRNKVHVNHYAQVCTNSPFTLPPLQNKRNANQYNVNYASLTTTVHLKKGFC